MQPPPQSYSCLPLLAGLLCVGLARSAPLQPSNTYVIPLPWNNLVGTFDFPDQQEQSQIAIPQPRALSVSVEDASGPSGPSGQEGDDLQQVLWLTTSGLIPAQIGQIGQRSQGRFFGRGGSTVVVVTNGSGSVSNNNNSTFVSPPAATTTTGTRTSEFIRAPIAYPAMQYFRKRQDDGSSPAAYPELFGWNAATFYGDDLGLSGGPNGGFGLPGVPLVPITVGNEVRYVPMNLRMYRQLVGDATSVAPPPPPAIREQDDQLEDNDISALTMGADLEVLNESANEGGQEVAGSGHSVVDSSGFGILGQRLRPRPLARRRPLQTLAQNIRRVQYLTQ